jgi:hypothetical protein
MLKVLSIAAASIALASPSCQSGMRGGGEAVPGVKTTLVATSPTSPLPTSSVQAMCQPTSIFIYDDVSKSINKDVSHKVKESFLNGLERQPVPCAVSIQFVPFGTGSVWSNRAERFDLPPPPLCGEPDYNRLPASVRNLAPWREKLRAEHAAQCANKDATFKKEYAAALASLRAALLGAHTEGAPNGCTSFANVIERISADAQKTSEEIYFVVISDLKWDCKEYEPPPLYEKGTLIQLADARTDDKIKVSPVEESKRLKRLFPKAVVVQGVHAEDVASSLRTEFETSGR